MHSLLSRTTIAALALLSIACSLAPGAADDPVDAPGSAPEGLRRPRPAAAATNWPTGLERGVRRAQTDGKPIFVRVGAEWCSWCEKLEAELAGQGLEQELSRWSLIYVDVDQSPDEAKQLSVGPIPALRILDATGKVLASHDGYLSQGELRAWLTAGFALATKKRPDVLVASRPLIAGDLDELLEALASNDPFFREAAQRRLQSDPQTAARRVVAALAQGKLSLRLSALEVLTHWQAPIAGLDPWRPETLTAERLKALEAWVAQENFPAAIETLSDEQRAFVAAQWDRLRRIDDAEAATVIEQLARHRAQLHDEVARRLKAETDDRMRERLQWLKYRLVSSDTRALDWPGGLARLASRETAVRRAAASQLADLATPADEALLLEMFADADPLVREVSLRGIKRLGTEASSTALLRLLSDPEPNVRAAVLKELLESPEPAIGAKIASYLETETDPDLVVHAVRVLKETRTAEPLIRLLTHESWQVRAEAAEALAEMASRMERQEAKADVYVALIEVLSDSEPFVVSRAMRGLRNSHLAAAVEPLIQVADKFPELSAEVVEALSQQSMTPKTLTAMRRFANDPNPQLRARVLVALGNSESDDLEDLILAGLQDTDPAPRAAAAAALFRQMEKIRERMQNTERSRTMSLRFGAAAEPPAEDDDTSDEDDDPTLVDFIAGKGRPKWMQECIGPLQKMIEHTDQEGRLNATIALAPLGVAGMPLRYWSVEFPKHPDRVERASQILPWLLWRDRLAWFDMLVRVPSDQHDLATIARNMIEREPQRGANHLWTLLKPEGLKTDFAAAIGQTILGVDDYQSFGNKISNSLLKNLLDFAENGSPWQRVVALAALTQAAPDEAVELARAMTTDEAVPREFRADAYHLLLCNLEPKQGEALAVRELKSDDPSVRKLSFSYLTFGADGLGRIHDAIYVFTNRSFNFSTEDALPEVPAGLDVAYLRKQLAGADEELAASAAYLLALDGDGQGLPLLIRKWRQDPKRGRWTEPLYQAIAALDDEANMPLLVEINNKLDEWEKRKFYWTIRTMQGAGALKLRKEIRDEVGMDRLR